MSIIKKIKDIFCPKIYSIDEVLYHILSVCKNQEERDIVLGKEISRILTEFMESSEFNTIKSPKSPLEAEHDEIVRNKCEYHGYSPNDIVVYDIYGQGVRAKDYYFPR